MSEKDMAKLCMTTVAEVLKQLSLDENKMEHSNATSSVNHVIPTLKKDDLNDYMAWSDFTVLIWQLNDLWPLMR